MSFIAAYEPADLDRLITEAIEEGDVEFAFSLYEPGAAFVLPTGEITTSPELIRRELETVIAMKPKLTIEEQVTILHEDGTLATTRVRGHMDGTAPDGSPLRYPFHTLGVSRKQRDGTWRFAIDDTQGSAKG